MFSKVALFVASAFAVAAFAAPGGAPGASYTSPSTSSSTTSNMCNSGPVQCCNDVQSAENNGPLQGLLGLLGVATGDVNGQVGVTCNPVNVIGTGGVNCNSQTVCCENNSFNGLVALGCTPINLNL